MTRLSCRGNCIRSGFIGLIWLLSISFSRDVLAQEKEQYIMGEDGQLEMIVHIIGEVKKPGEYRVRDNTNLMELISKANGPTEFSNLRAVSITRVNFGVMANGKNGNHLKKQNKIIKYDVGNYLKKSIETPPPVLKPGDIVFVPRNNWHKWRNTFTIIRDLSVVASVYFLYLRATD
ncbi:MAG: polysaccharide biosynthesis/export family protein [bacterium]